MNKKLIIYTFFIGIISLLASCEKDETKVVMLSNPVAPALNALPDLALVRSNGANTLEFAGTIVDPGFTASANYFLEAAAAGTNFLDPVTIITTTVPTSMKITVGDLNSLLIRKFPADQVSSLDFRLRSVLSVDAGTGAKGTSSDPFQYISEAKTVNVTLYGLPRLDLIFNGAIIGKVESSLGDGKYIGYVKLDKTKPFTLKDPDANIVYGKNGTALKVDGTAILTEADGYHKITVNTSDLSYSVDPYVIGVVGAFNNWAKPDALMEYDTQNGWWYTTMDLPTGPMKFRLNENWDAANWGPGEDKDLPSDGVLALPKSSGNINITKAGNYTIQVTITGASGTSKFIKNN